ncbi:hypothetical protein [Parachitinimonas caeni]|uniref:Uncharacterized protein n=1 Tax=Parachitinimonas caeni TaxID=3031301 RepID=A0ABT7DYE6_9NEIS|nr:hypothetical protein [Parachitinimonas caeni]MDK2125083.1 hypothetical protein [Parachitinimonas caeni]
MKTLVILLKVLLISVLSILAIGFGLCGALGLSIGQWETVGLGAGGVGIATVLGWLVVLLARSLNPAHPPKPPEDESSSPPPT